MMKNKGNVLILLGVVLSIAALALTAHNLYDNLRAEQSARQVVNRLKEDFPTEDMEPLATGEMTEIPDYILNQNMEMPVENVDGSDYIGVLRIPALGLELPILSQWSYPDLKTAPCRYSGSAYLNNLIICGHNYSSHFGSLKNIWEGDIAAFTDMDGNVFTYKVVEREILNPTDLEEMERGNWDLTLFTCTMGGKTRMTIRLALVED